MRNVKKSNPLKVSPPSLADDLFARAAAQPSLPAVLGPHPGDAMSYADLAQHIRALAIELEATGLCAGMNIGLHIPSGIAYICYTYAIWACGACVTPIPTELAGAEKRLIPQVIAIDAVIAAPRGHAVLIEETGRIAAKLADGMLVLGGTRQCKPPAALAGLHPAFIRFTSGTTGSAKGVVLSHATIHERIAAANAVMTIGPGDRVLWLLSMAYHFAVSIVAYLSYGATIVLPANAFGAGMISAATQHGVTLVYGAPTHYDLMVNDRNGQLPATLRLAMVTTAQLKMELAQRFEARFGVALNETYGIIEVGLPAINHDAPSAPRGSVGRILPAYTLKLAQPGNAVGAEDVENGGCGEILLRGPGLLDAYYEPWRTRSEILAEHDGWLATGDLGRLDAAGYLTLVGRAKEVISVAGMKFFPQEIEAVLERCDGVAEACAYAIPDERHGELPHADVVPKAGLPLPDPLVLKQRCQAELALYKVPVQIRLVAALPRTASGKLLRCKVDPIAKIKINRV